LIKLGGTSMILSKPSSAAQISLLYITIGALTDVWSGIWYAYMLHSPPENDFTWYCCYGTLLTGLTLLVIGLGIGRIGRSARHAELPPEEVTPAVAKAEQDAAARAPVIAAVNPATPAVTNGAAPAVLATPTARPLPRT
jgi:hypothetical protein